MPDPSPGMAVLNAPPAGGGGGAPATPPVNNGGGGVPNGGTPNNGAGTGVTPPTGDNWFSPEYAGLVQQKGWQTPADALKGYANLETLLGEKATAIVPPKSDAAPEEWARFYQKLGAPADPSGYKFDKTGLNPEVLNEATKWFQSQGLNDKQAENLIKNFSEFQKNTQTNDEAKFATQGNNDLIDLQKEWGNKFDDTVELARRATQYAMKEAGLTPEQLNAFEKAVGTKTLLKMMAGYGNMFKEGTAPNTGGNTDAFRGTPEFAKGEIARLRSDPAFQQQYNHHNPTVRNQAIDQMERLYKQAFGDKPIG